MWQAISQQLSETLQFDFNIQERTRISGGDINQCFMISDQEQRYFVKVNEKRHSNIFSSEVQSLAALRDSRTVSVPEVITNGTTSEHAFLILNYIPTKQIELDKDAEQFGQQLAHLHLWGEQAEYGFDEDNYVGLTLQPNSWQKKWATFFAEQRIGWQLQLLKEKGVIFGDIDDIVDVIASRLHGHQPTPSLLHGDLWSGNVNASPFGPLCFDPACYWGDRECDVALTELFQPLNKSFYIGYQDIAPLASGYAERRPIYNLYHLLNHCNLFGGDYLPQTHTAINQLLAR